MYDSLSWLAYTAHVLSQKASSQQETLQQQQQKKQHQQSVNSPHQHPPASQDSIYRDGLASEPDVDVAIKVLPGIAKKAGGDDNSDADYRCEDGSDVLEEGSSDDDVRRAALGQRLQGVSTVPGRRERLQGRTGSESTKMPGPSHQAGLGCCQGDLGQDRSRERQRPAGQLRLGRRAASPVIDGELSYGCGCGDNTVSGGGRRSSGRRPVQFWAPFNDWWRSELQRSGKRPGSELVGDWYAAHAAACWGRDAPSLDETRTHAKCLRSVGSIREYFRNYRARKKARLEDQPTLTAAVAGNLSNASAASDAKGPAAFVRADDLPGAAVLPSLAPHLPPLNALSLSPLHLQLAAAAMAVASKTGTLDASIGALQLGGFPESLQAFASAVTAMASPCSGSDASRSAPLGLHGAAPDAVATLLALVPSRAVFHDHAITATNSACKPEGGLQVLPLQAPPVAPGMTVTPGGGLGSPSPGKCVAHRHFAELRQQLVPSSITLAAPGTSCGGSGEARGGIGGHISTPRSGRTTGPSAVASPPPSAFAIAGVKAASERPGSMTRPSDVSRNRYDTAGAGSGSARAAADSGSDGDKSGSSEPKPACNQGNGEGKGSCENNAIQLPPGVLAQTLLAAMQCVDGAAVVRINPRRALGPTAALAAPSAPIREGSNAQDQERQLSMRTAGDVTTANAEDSEDLTAVQSASIGDGCRNMDQSSPLAATAGALQPFRTPSPSVATPTERLGVVADDSQANRQEQKTVGPAPQVNINTAQELAQQAPSSAPPPPPVLAAPQQHRKLLLSDKPYEVKHVHPPVSPGPVANAQMHHSYGGGSSGGGGTSSGTHTPPVPRHGYPNHCFGHSSQHGPSIMYPAVFTAGEMAVAGTIATVPGTAGTAMVPNAPSLGSLLARPDDEICGLMGGLQREQLEVLLLRAVAMVRHKRAHEERLMDELAQVFEQQGHLQLQLHSQRMETARMYRTLMAMRDARGSSGGGVDSGTGMGGDGECNTAGNVMAAGHSSVNGACGIVSDSLRQGFHSWSAGLEDGEGLDAAGTATARELLMRRAGAADAPCGLRATDQSASATAAGPLSLWTIDSPRGPCGGVTTVRRTTLECVPSVLLRGLSAPYDNAGGASRKPTSKGQASKLDEHDSGSDVADASDAALTVLGMMGVSGKQSGTDAKLSGGGSSVGGTTNKMPAACSDGGSGVSSAF